MPETGYSGNLKIESVNPHEDTKITEETNSYRINRDFEKDPSQKRR